MQKKYVTDGAHNRYPAYCCDDVDGLLGAHNHAASAITEGTFAGEVAASASGQAYNTFLLRNSKLVSTETTPDANGAICWTYE